MTHSDTTVDRFRMLLGHPPVQDFLRFVKTRSINGESCDDIALARHWQAGNMRLRELAASSRGCADIDPLNSIPDSIRADANAALQDPAIQKSLGFLPFSWAWVELDRLIVWQHFVEISATDRLRVTLSTAPGPSDLLKVATGRALSPPDVQVINVSRNKFTFSSESADLRVLGAVPLDPSNVTGYQPYGYASSVIGVFVGYSINLMMAARMNDRLVLTNGTHRAYALRALGITHAPCVVSHITHGDDIDLLGLPVSRSAFEAKFTMARPPLLRDFFDERLSMTILAPRETQLIQVEMKCEHARAPVPHGVE